VLTLTDSNDSKIGFKLDLFLSVRRGRVVIDFNYHRELKQFRMKWE